jgi:Na+/proline symporter
VGFGVLDLIIVVFYLAGVTALGAWFRRRQHSIRDYFLGGRDTPWPAICLSIVATETSTLTIIGTPTLAYAGNLAFLQLVALSSASCSCPSISPGGSTPPTSTSNSASAR